jgi:acetate kinase
MPNGTTDNPPRSLVKLREVASDSRQEVGEIFDRRECDSETGSWPRRRKRSSMKWRRNTVNLTRALALNAGAASHIAKCFEVLAPAPLDPPAAVWEDEVETSDSTFAELLERLPAPPPDIVAHRVVHPGLDPSIGLDERIDGRVLGAIRDGRAFAPGHNGLALEGIEVAQKRFPDAVQIAIFDRALDDGAPEIARIVPGPYLWRERGLRRMGFHGISHRDVVERITAALGRDDAKLVTIHLGSGCSMSAVREGALVENTMGLTPLEGLVMGARGGSIDPGILLHLIASGTTAEELSQTLNHDAGLKGISGISLDTRDVYAASDAGSLRARLALDVYCYRIRQGIGAMAAVLGGIDALTFSGPVGEHMPRIRDAVTRDLAFLGIAIDTEANDALPKDGLVPLTDISAADARVRTFVVPTLEEWAMCRRAMRLLDSNSRVR